MKWAEYVLPAANPEVDRFCASHALTFQKLADLLEVDARTVYRWRQKPNLNRRNRLALSALSQELEEVQS